MGILVDYLIYGIVVLFTLGVIGCVVVIPSCAFKMFAVLLEKDVPGEKR